MSVGFSVGVSVTDGKPSNSTVKPAIAISPPESVPSVMVPAVPLTSYEVIYTVVSLDVSKVNTFVEPPLKISLTAISLAPLVCPAVKYLSALPPVFRPYTFTVAPAATLNTI